jgi:hypothetical protein
MSELALTPSETRAIPRQPAARGILRPVLLAACGAGALAGVAMGASTVIGDLLAAPVRPATMLKTSAPAIQSGLASQWPDLKDGLPAVAGATVKTTSAAPDSSPQAEPPRMAALSTPPMTVPGLPAAPPAVAPPSAPLAKAEAPSRRIPVATEVATAAPPAPTKVIVPSRTAALLPPRETIQAEDDTPKPVQEVAKRAQEVAKPVQEAAKPKREAAKHHEEAARTREAVAKPPVPRPTVTAATPAAAVEKTKKVALTSKPASHGPEAAKPTVVATATASAEPEETDILGVKLPSLAPAGRKIREGVTALGDAVRNAF